MCLNTYWQSTITCLSQTHIQLLPGKSGDAWLVYLNKATTELALGQVNPCLTDLEEARLLHGQPDVLLFANKALALERLGKYPQVCGCGLWGVLLATGGQEGSGRRAF